MVSKSIDQLTLRELRYECDSRDLSSTGAKPDLQIRLAEFLRTTGVDPSRVLFTISAECVDNEQVRGESIVTDTVPPTNASLLGGDCYQSFTVDF